MSTASLPPEIRGLPVADRLDLVERIWIASSRIAVISSRRKLRGRNWTGGSQLMMPDPDRGSSREDVKERLVED